MQENLSNLLAPCLTVFLGVRPVKYVLCATIPILVTLPVACTQCQTTGPADRPPEYAYILHQNPNETVAEFQMHNGLQPLRTSSIKVGFDPSWIASDPHGRFVYVINRGDKTVSQFRVGLQGSLIPVVSPCATLVDYPYRMVVSPDSRSMYVSTTEKIFQYHILSNGRLKPLVPFAIPTGYEPTDMKFAPLGHRLYVLSQNFGEPTGYNGSIYSYAVQPDGQLKPFVGSASSVGDIKFPKNLAMSRNGEYIYVGSGNNSGGEYTGRGLFIFHVLKDGQLQQVLPRAPAEPSHRTMDRVDTNQRNKPDHIIVDPVLDVTTKVFTGIRSNRVFGIASAHNGSNNILWCGIQVQGAVKITAKYSILNGGRLVPADYEKGSDAVNISDIVIDESASEVYLINYTSADQVFGYKSDDAVGVNGGSLEVFHVGSEPYQMILVKTERSSAYADSSVTVSVVGSSGSASVSPTSLSASGTVTLIFRHSK